MWHSDICDTPDIVTFLIIYESALNFKSDLQAFFKLYLLSIFNLPLTSILFVDGCLTLHTLFISSLSLKSYYLSPVHHGPPSSICSLHLQHPLQGNLRLHATITHTLLRIIPSVIRHVGNLRICEFHLKNWTLWESNPALQAAWPTAPHVPISATPGIFI